MFLFLFPFLGALHFLLRKCYRLHTTNSALAHTRRRLQEKLLLMKQGCHLQYKNDKLYIFIVSLFLDIINISHPPSHSIIISLFRYLSPSHPPSLPLPLSPSPSPSPSISPSLNYLTFNIYVIQSPCQYHDVRIDLALRYVRHSQLSNCGVDEKSSGSSGTVNGQTDFDEFSGIQRLEQRPLRSRVGIVAPIGGDVVSEYVR